MVNKRLGYDVADKDHFKSLLRKSLGDFAAATAATKKVTAAALIAARHERLSQTSGIQHNIITWLSHPQLRAVPPHLMPLAVCYVNGEAGEEHVLGRSCVITENTIR
jgi:hypothetical protein